MVMIATTMTERIGCSPMKERIEQVFMCSPSLRINSVMGSEVAARIEALSGAVDKIGIGNEALPIAARADFIHVEEVLTGRALALAAEDQSAVEIERVDFRLSV